MDIGEIFDRLDEARMRIVDGIHDRGLEVDLGDERFTLMRVSKSERGSDYLATLVVETDTCLRVPLERRLFIEAGTAKIDVELIVADTLRTIAALATVEHERTHLDLVAAVEQRFADVREIGGQLSMVRLDARPVQTSQPDVQLRYELTSKMLDSTHEDRSYVLRVIDADDFSTCFAEEVLPEQRARAARAAGLTVPEAVND